MTGWECPKCGQVYAPFVAQCYSCRPKPAATGTEYDDGRCPSCGGYRNQQAGTGCPMGFHYGTACGATNG